MNKFRFKTEVLIIGTGVAGSLAALTLADAGLHATLITAGDNLMAGNTRLAQGGIVYTAGEGDSKKLEKDIYTAGWKENYQRGVRFVAQKGPEAVKETLIDRYNVPFARKDSGDLYMLKEGGHSEARIICCADHTGRTIMEHLSKAVAEHPNIDVRLNRTAIDLLTSHHHAHHLDFRYSLVNQCAGAYVYNQEYNLVETILADFTILATGGAGQVYLHTTNTHSSIGSGLAMAFRAKARTMNAEYVQFHPTTLFQRKRSERSFLISEAVRGEGAKLINHKGEAFMTRYDPRADLAPRDIVTRAIMEEMLKTGEDCVYLDAYNHVNKNLKERFPTIYENCMNIGVDMAKEPIPVVPAAHYFCGGVLVDTRGRTTVDRLYGAGECTCSGIHGANRLASVSLLEGVLWGIASAEDIIARHKKSSQLTKRLMDAIPDWECTGHVHNEDPALISQDWASLRNTMWNYVGITRTTDRLNRAIDEMRNMSRNLQDFYRKTPISKPIIDLFHGCQAAYIITMASLRNKTTKGCHYRAD